MNYADARGEQRLTTPKSGGVSEGEIMKLCGWKTRAMFDRHNILDEHDLARAVARRFNSTEQAQSTPVERDPSHVS